MDEHLGIKRGDKVGFWYTNGPWTYGIVLRLLNNGRLKIYYQYGDGRRDCFEIHVSQVKKEID